MSILFALISPRIENPGNIDLLNTIQVALMFVDVAILVSLVGMGVLK
jgi:hypothetical protein